MWYLLQLARWFRPVIFYCFKLLKQGEKMNSSVSHLLSNSSKRIGTNAVLKGVANQEIRCVILASDADSAIIDNVKRCCEENGVGILTVPSKEELGKACKIDVACACVGIINDNK